MHRYAKGNNKYLKNYDKNKESSYIQYLDANDLFGWAMSQKLPVYGLNGLNILTLIKNMKSLKNLSKTMMKKVTQDIFLK